MLELEKLFKQLDEIDDIEILSDIREGIKDYKYTGVFWAQRKIALLGKTEVERKRAAIKCGLIAKKYAACIPVTKNIKKFATPHGFAGIHISIGAQIGENCTILQHAVIGSNTFLDSKNHGFPVIGDNVFIGAGAMIIGNVKVGNNARIGANCVVTRDVPDNCVVVGAKANVIVKEQPLDNTFITGSKYLKNIKNDNK